MEVFEFKLNNSAIDEISELIFRHCLDLKVEKKKAFSFRLNAEEALLDWMEFGCGEGDVTLRFDRRMLANVIDLYVTGPQLNPFSEESEEFGDYSAKLLESMNLIPEYGYITGRNKITFRLPQKKMGQLPLLCCVFVAALAVGFLGNMFIPEATRAVLITDILSPIQSLFYKILGFIAGPMIFLSVAWGIYGIGDPKTFGQIGKKFILRFIGESLIFALLALITMPLIGPTFGAGASGENQVEKLIEMVLNIFPPNIIEPFHTGNTLQIIFVAVICGLTLLFIGERGSGIARGIEQFNHLIQFQMGVVAGFVPYVIFFVIVKLIWSGSLGALAKLWLLPLVCLSMYFIILMVYFVATAMKLKMDIRKLIKKILPSFMIALATASSSAAFPSNMEICENDFGIRKDIVGFGIPLGMIMNRSLLAPNFMMYGLFFSKMAGVQASGQWLVMMIITAVLVAIATPPVAGGGAIAFTLLFAQAGIPAEYLSMAFTIDIILDFFLTASQVTTVAVSLLFSAADLKMVDEKILKN